MKTTDPVEENLAYYNGDHWLFWIGPTLPKSDPKYEAVTEQIKKVFQSSNRVKECIDRHRTALVGKRPHWYLTDLTGERMTDNTASDAEKLLQRWIDRQYQMAVSGENQLPNPITECVKNMLVTGCGYLRLWSPKRFRNSFDPMMRVCLHSPSSNAINVVRDADGFIDSIEYTYAENDKQHKEIQFLDPETNMTIFQILEFEEIIQTFALDLGGKFSIYEMRSPTLITQSIKQAQNAINFALTMMPRNIEVGGFRERLILGAQPPGRWEGDKFIPDSNFRIGPGQTSFIQGVPLLDDVGNLRGYTNPSVFNSEPVDVESFISTSLAFTAVIYHEMKQSHLLGSDLQLSGVSKEQSRQDFETALEDHADIVAAPIAGIYGAALMMMLQDMAEKYRSLNVMVQLRLNASKPTPDERAANREDYKAGLRSRTTAMAQSGIDDVDGETALIKEEEAERSALDDASTLVTSGLLDQPAAVSLLKQRGKLPKDIETEDNTSEALNGRG